MQSFHPSDTIDYVTSVYTSKYPIVVPSIVTLIQPSDIPHNITVEESSEHLTVV